MRVSTPLSIQLYLVETPSRACALRPTERLFALRLILCAYLARVFLRYNATLSLQHTIVYQRTGYSLQLQDLMTHDLIARASSISPIFGLISNLLSLLYKNYYRGIFLYFVFGAYSKCASAHITPQLTRHHSPHTSQRHRTHTHCH